MRVPVAVWQPCELLYTCYFTYLLSVSSEVQIVCIWSTCQDPADATANEKPSSDNSVDSDFEQYRTTKAISYPVVLCLTRISDW